MKRNTPNVCDILRLLHILLTHNISLLPQANHIPSVWNTLSRVDFLCTYLSLMLLCVSHSVPWSVTFSWKKVSQKNPRAPLNQRRLCSYNLWDLRFLSVETEWEYDSTQARDDSEYLEMNICTKFYNISNKIT